MIDAAIACFGTMGDVVDPQSLTRPLRVLRLCLHLLTAALLALAVVHALLDELPHSTAITAVAVVMGVIYAAGAGLPQVARSVTAAGAWLAVITVIWVLLVWLTPDGVWLAFPLFFLQLHLLARTWAVATVAVTTLVAIGGFAWHQHTLAPAMMVGPALGAAVAVATVLGYQALYRESEHRRRLIDQLTATRNDLAEAQHTAGVLAERERLAREIHDTLAQGLSSIQLLLRAAERALPDQPETAAEHLKQARIAAQDNLAEARQLVHALTPPDLASGSLPAALRRLCTATVDRSGIAVNLHLSGTPVTIPTPYEVALLRIAQSALANTVQHATAGAVEVTLSYMDTRVALDVVDDGVGFDVTRVPATDGTSGGFGLNSMRARTRALGGTLSVESTPGRGTALAVSFSHQDDVAQEPART